MHFTGYRKSFYRQQIPPDVSGSEDFIRTDAGPCVSFTEEQMDR